MFLYLQGSPKQYRFNGQTGEFNINGDTPILDEKGKKSQSLSIQPIAFRLFSDLLFARGKEEIWAEIFFLDQHKAISSIMFNNSSANEFSKFLQATFYEQKALSDYVLTIRYESKSNDKGSWYIARFEGTEADPAVVEELKAFDLQHKIHRTSTLTSTAVYRLYSGTFFDEYVPQLTQSRELEVLKLSE